MLGPGGEPLARKYYSEKTEKDLDENQMVRGYEVEKDKYVVVTDEELERLAPEKSSDIDLTRFVDEDSIPPVYFERGYFLTPDGKSEKAYKLLAAAMEKSGKAGVATFVMRGKEHLIAIFSDHGILRGETMRFPDELRSPEDIELPKKNKVPPAKVKKFATLISRKARKTFSPAKLKDEEARQLLTLVKRKKSKRSNVVEIESEKGNRDNVIDIMQVLKKSLAGSSQKAS
jgi:DNA end-binding protein Ku